MTGPVFLILAQTICRLRQARASSAKHAVPRSTDPPISQETKTYSSPLFALYHPFSLRLSGPLVRISSVFFCNIFPPNCCSGFHQEGIKHRFARFSPEEERPCYSGLMSRLHHWEYSLMDVFSAQCSLLYHKQCTLLSFPSYRRALSHPSRCPASLFSLCKCYLWPALLTSPIWWKDCSPRREAV